MRNSKFQSFLLSTLTAILLIAAVTPAHAVLFCRRHDCSNDVLDATADPVLGDERVSWAELVTWQTSLCGAVPAPTCDSESNQRCYEVGLYPEQTVVARICAMEWVDPQDHQFRYVGPQTSFSPYATSAEYHPRVGSTNRYIVRACEGTSCSDWRPTTADGSQDYIEIIGADYACFGAENGARCEQECYPGAPKMFAAIPDCENPI